MPRRRTVEEPPPPRTDRPLRQVVLYLTITYGLALAIALALPNADIAPLISIVVPVIAVALTVAFAVPRSATRRLGDGRIQPTQGARSAHRRPGTGSSHCRELQHRGCPRGGPVSRLGSGFGSGVLSIAVTTIIFTFVLLGEEIGWRGYLLFRLAELTSGRRAALLTGAFHAIFHLPLLLLTTTYQSAGSRWIVVPMVMVTLTGRGLVRVAAPLVGQHLAVSLSHSTFNNLMEGVGGVAIATSPAMMA